ncbi:MAG: hypothetical protein IPM14_01990 [bacterium]|nr:hypothetical protein [bacterium]
MKDQHYAQVNELDNITVSYSHNTHNPYLTQTTLRNIFNRIKEDSELERIVNAIRSESDKDKRRKLKEKNLPYFVLGTFEGNHRKSDKLISTQFISIDFDDLNGKAIELDEILKADENVFAFFKSPSNNRKVIYKLNKPITDRKEFSHIYTHFLNMLNSRYGFEADSQTSDAARAIFLSYDPDIYVNINARPLDTQQVPEPILAESFDIELNPSEDKDLYYLPTAIDFLKYEKLNYKEWIICGLALTLLGEHGKKYFVDLSINDYYDDSLEEILDKYDNLLENSQGEITLASLFKIAKDHGYEYPDLGYEIPIQEIDFADELISQFEFDDKRDPNKLLGLPLTKFNTLANNIDGIQPGFYFLGAESNVGKTALLTNLALDVLDTNSDATVLYFSLDDSRLYTTYRCLSILTGFHINSVRKPNVKHTDFQTLQAQRNVFLKYVKNERLILKDLSEVYHMDHLMKFIEAYQDRENLVVFVDGLYNMEVDAGKNEGIRVQNIEKANKIKLITDKYGIPLIATGDLRKKLKGESKKTKPTMHDLMETGRYAYNANVIWLLYPLDHKEMNETDMILELEFAKNKLSDFKGIQHLDFFRSTGKMKEVNVNVISKNKVLITAPNSGGELE